ncbi:MAG TPA: hypothetical protein VGM88_24920 [Kofleriaceae bacterium]|jgi:hypothetical protein
MRNLLIVAALATAAGCYDDAEVVATPGYATVAADGSMETIAPGVQVVDDLDYPVFFSDGFYWRYDDGFWYRSSFAYGGWVGVGFDYVPWGVRGIHEPWGYAHWHGGYARGGVVARGAYGGYYRGGGYHGGFRTYSARSAPSRAGGFRGGSFRGGGGGHHGGGFHGGGGHHR